MPIEIDDRGQALENEYFHRQEKELLAKMKAKLEAEKAENVKIICPRDGETNLKEVDFEGVKIDVCESCGGVWLDGGELAQLVNKEDNKSGWFSRLFE